MKQLHFHQMIHESSSESPISPHTSHHPTFPFIAVAIIGILATIFLLVFYYIFVIKCCLNWHRIDILRRFSLSRNTNHHNYHHPVVSSSLETTGLDESVIRSIPIFKFNKQKHSDNNNECAVCLGEFDEDEKLRIIPNCAHVFHIDCIDVWLQNNPNCPLCRNSISMHIPLQQNDNNIIIPGDEKDYVVIELHNESTNVGDGRNVSGEYHKPMVSRKMMEKFRMRYGYEHSSMGDECIGVNTRRKGSEDQLLIRRSVSLDSASDRQLFLAVQEIRSSLNHVDVNDGCNSSSSSSSSNSRHKKGLFSFGHARSAILPVHLNRKASI